MHKIDFHLYLEGSGFDHPTSSLKIWILATKPNRSSWKCPPTFLSINPKFAQCGQTDGGAESTHADRGLIFFYCRSCGTMSQKRGRRNLYWGQLSGGRNFHFVQMGQILCHFCTTRRHDSDGVLSFFIWVFDFLATFGSGLCRCQISTSEQSFSHFSTP